MAAPIERDPEETARALTAWLRSRHPERPEVVVTGVHAPPSSGFSGETLLVDTTGGPLVVRVAPTTYTVFLEPDFAAQYRVMAALADGTDVPMPEMLGLETDPSILGAPFSLMRRVEGEAAADAPPYTESGFIKDATPAQQARLYDSGLSAMAAVHTTDWRALDLGVVARDEYDYTERHLAWALDGLGADVPLLGRARDWIRDHRPAPAEPALCWGDARPGNLLFRDFAVVAVLDWEMVTIGDPVMDLGWWLFLERFHTVSAPPLPGFPGAAAAVRRWEELTGRVVDPDVLHVFRVFAGLRFGVVMVRLATLFQQAGLLPDATGMAQENPVLTLLAEELDGSLANEW